MSTPPTKYSPETVSLASLDPPGVERAEQEMQVMLMRRQILRADLPRAAATVPEVTLPRILIPHRGRKLRPPTLHYGWSGSLPPMLLQYAREHNLVQTIIWDKDLEVKRTDTFLSRLAAVFDIMEKHGLSRPDPCTLQVVASLNAGKNLGILSLYTNYDLHKAPSDEFVDALQKVLGEEDRPRWFMDVSKNTWVSWDYCY
ncbi:hypothetical protein B0H21DRAFT_894409 [Amylocystis lapponica]|nr:hypothetical protein B0H21DRAFT_894409 [Amylocystis lapponica]